MDVTGATRQDDRGAVAGPRTSPRLDWRFLLPSPPVCDPKLVGPPLAAAPDEELLRALGPPEQGDDRTSPKCRPRVLVMRDPRGTPDDVAAMLAPGDVAYLEHRRRFSVARLLRRDDSPSAWIRGLRRAGVWAEAYWVWPSFESCLEIAPLGDRGALRLALSRRSRRAGARLRAILAQALVDTGTFEIVAPDVATVARRIDTAGPAAAAVPTDDPMGFLVGWIEGQRERLDLARHGIPGRPSGVMLTPRFAASTHVIVLVTSLGEARPRLVAKVHRLPCPSPATEREAENLRALGQLGLPDGVVPELIAFEEVAGYPLLVETALPGRSVDPTEIRRNRTAVIREVDLVLRRLVEPPGAPSPADRYEREIEAPLAALARAFEASAIDLARLAVAARTLAVLADAAVPVAFEHGDLAHPNLLWRPEGGIAAIDWELGVPAGLPLQDLTFFLAHVGLAVERPLTDADHATTVHGTLLAPDAWGPVVLRTHADAIGLDARLIRPLIVATWTRYLARHAARTPGGLPSGRFLEIWRAVVDATAGSGP